MIPGANILADIAAEQPIADAGAKFVRNRLPQLDGQVTDASPRIEHISIDKRLRRAGIQTSSAGAAVVGFMRRVVFQLQVGQQCRQKEPTSHLFVQQQSVFADPA